MVTTENKNMAGPRGDNAFAGPVVIHRRIGPIAYEVEIHFNSGAKEGMDDKRLRLIRRELEAAS